MIGDIAKKKVNNKTVNKEDTGKRALPAKSNVWKIVVALSLLAAAVVATIVIIIVVNKKSSNGTTGGSASGNGAKQQPVGNAPASNPIPAPLTNPPIPTPLPKQTPVPPKQTPVPPKQTPTPIPYNQPSSKGRSRSYTSGGGMGRSTYPGSGIGQPYSGGGTGQPYSGSGGSSHLPPPHFRRSSSFPPPPRGSSLNDISIARPISISDCKHNPISCGLENSGTNSCFFNSVMQCLIAVPKFIEFFMRGDFSAPGKELSRSFQGFIKDYYSREMKNIFPFDFKTAILAKLSPENKGLFNGNQQDAHEFLLMLIGMLEEENNVRTGGAPLPAGKRNIGNLFNLMLTQEITCRVNPAHKSIKILDSNINYSLNIKPGGSQTITRVIEEMAAPQHLQVEVVDGVPKEGWECPVCRTNVNAEMVTKISRSSEYVILQLARFSLNPTTGKYERNNSPVNVEDQLTIGGTKYYCIGVVNHFGSMESGHYTCDVKRYGKWYNISDSQITERPRNNDGVTPYILFYSRIDSV